MSVNVSAFPFCAKRLEWNYTDLKDPAMTKYWAAVVVAEPLDDAELAKFGGFDFSDMSDENGSKLLGRLEQFLCQHNGKKALSDHGGMSTAEASVRAFLGANGVKVSKLGGLEDYWTAATTLWPGLIETKPRIKDIYTLRFQLDRIPRKQRPKVARSNLRNLPAPWNARTAA